jgi:ABC-type uncharacterized transport system substrate-binding protein
MGLLFRGLEYALMASVGTTSRPPKWIKPQLTRLVDEAPTGNGWLHEIKYDGYRMHARIDGRDIKLLTRTGLDWSHRPARYPELAREIVRSQPDVIYMVDSGQVRALLALSTTIPILAQNVSLVDAGLADGISRPGRNVTGYSLAFSGLQFALKRLQLLREAVPAASRIAVLTQRTPWNSDSAHQFREAASRMGATMVGALLDDPVQPAEYRRVFAAMPDQRIEAVWVPESSHHYVHRDLVVDLATDSRLPAITGWRVATERGD